MKIVNRRAYHDYEILETYEAGIHLIGPEVKSVRGEHMTFEGSFVKIVGSEVYLVNAQIAPYPFARTEGYDPKRTRKLLLHKKEILRLKMKIHGDRLTLIPIECYTSNNLVKLKIGLAKGKRQFEKREKLKKRDTDREIERTLKR